jgi:hypothetical protein
MIWSAVANISAAAATDIPDATNPFLRNKKAIAVAERNGKASRAYAYSSEPIRK